MHITINKNNLYYNKYKVKCALGKRGIGNKRREGDKITPYGLFKIKYVLFRKDRVKNLHTKLSKKNINKNMGWCDDPSSKFYNKLIDIKSSANKEKMYRNDTKYDYLLVINYNRKKIVKNKGSAIFLHLTKNFKSTAGCIGVSQKDFLIIVKLLKKNSKIKIS